MRNYNIRALRCVSNRNLNRVIHICLCAPKYVRAGGCHERIVAVVVDIVGDVDTEVHVVGIPCHGELPDENQRINPLPLTDSPFPRCSMFPTSPQLRPVLPLLTLSLSPSPSPPLHNLSLRHHPSAQLHPNQTLMSRSRGPLQ